MSQKHYLVTGATAGIGLATARSLVSAGHKVTITGRDQARLRSAAAALAEAGSGEVVSLMCDSGDLNQIRAMAQSLQQARVRLDGLVLNAGIFFPQMFSEMTEENFDQTMAVNHKGPFFSLQALLPVLNNPASVVFISSVAVRKAFASAAVYSASKAAFEGATRVLNLELAERGIRINSVRPGVTATEIQSKAGMTDEQIAGLAEAMAVHPLGRILTPADMVPAIDYLLSDASMGLRDAHLDIDGGFAL